MAHDKGSFSYKTINEKTKSVLQQRSRLNNTAQVGMPFVKATTTLKLPEVLGPDCVGFTLGTHAIEIDGLAENIYSDTNGNALIGYTYNPDGTTKRVYATVNTAQIAANELFNTGQDLYSNTNFSFIPPPGITSVKVGRNKNGLLSMGEINFSVPTLPQLEILHRTFLVPNCGMILEWGQQFAPEVLSSTGEAGLTNTSITEHLFPWYNRDELLTLLKRIAVNEVGLQEILNDYVYPTQGQYMWMFGRVANFSTKSNSDGSFDCTVKIIGSSEDAWAYSTRNTIVPPRISGKICPGGANSVETYMTTTVPGLNLKSLLEAVASPAPSKDGVDYSAWAGHVVRFERGNTTGGEPQVGADPVPAVNEITFGDSQDAYFMTWRFFVNVVLNDEVNGIKAIFKRAGLLDDELKKVAVLRPYTVKVNNEPVELGRAYIDDEYENFVGNNRYLRSVDPSVLIIVNEEAVKFAKSDIQLSGGTSPAQDLTADTEMTQKFAALGDFYFSAAAVPGAVGPKTDKGLLSTGVWLNHKAVVQSMASSDTIVRGLSNLLDRMNSATLNFWQLTLDLSEPVPELPSSISYTVIDSNYRENSDYATKKFLTDVHTFNKYIRRENGQLVGSEVFDCTVDLALPKRLFSQIATTGMVQPQDIDSGAPDTPIISDPNDTLRRMFAITSISTRAGITESPDLTVLTKTDRARLISGSTCAGTVAQPTAGVAGIGAAAASTPAPDAASAAASASNAALLTQRTQAETQLASELCLRPDCAAAVAAAQPTLVATPIGTTATSVTYATIYSDEPTSTVAIDYNFAGGSNPAAKSMYAAGYRNGRVPANALKSIGRGHSMFPEVADKFLAMNAAYKAATGKELIVGSSYRPFDVQVQNVARKGYYSGLFPAPPPRGQGDQGMPNPLLLNGQKRKGLSAQPGTSNHGWGLAVDVSLEPGTLTWLSANAAKFGFQKIAREDWHWEYFQPLAQPIRRVTIGATPTSAPAAARPAASTTPSQFRAVFVTGITESISANSQIQSFKEGIGQNKRIFTAGYNNISAVETFLAQNPKTPVFLFSAGASGENVSRIMNSPNLDKQKLFLIEPYFGTDSQESPNRQAVVDAISQGLPPGNVYVGPSPNRGGGTRKISGTSDVPSTIGHGGAPLYVGRQKQQLVAAEASPPPPGDIVAGEEATPRTTPDAAPAPSTPGPADCAPCVLAAQQLQQVESQLQENLQSREQIFREFGGLSTIFKYVEPYGDVMTARITRDADGISSNAFGASPASLSISADISLPGINGLRVGELFWIDRIPAFYKAFGAFQIMSIEENIGREGWQTKIHARFNYLGNQWKESVVRLLGQTLATQQG